MRYDLGVFLNFQYLKVNINTFFFFNIILILDIVKVFLPIPVDVDNLLNHVKFMCFLFLFFLIFLLRIATRKSTKTLMERLYLSIFFSLISFIFTLVSFGFYAKIKYIYMIINSKGIFIIFHLKTN